MATPVLTPNATRCQRHFANRSNTTCACLDSNTSSPRPAYTTVPRRPPAPVVPNTDVARRHPHHPTAIPLCRPPPGPCRGAGGRRAGGSASHEPRHGAPIGATSRNRHPRPILTARRAVGGRSVLVIRLRLPHRRAPLSAAAPVPRGRCPGGPPRECWTTPRVTNPRGSQTFFRAAREIRDVAAIDGCPRVFRRLFGCIATDLGAWRVVHGAVGGGAVLPAPYFVGVWTVVAAPQHAIVVIEVG